MRQHRARINRPAPPSSADSRITRSNDCKASLPQRREGTAYAPLAHVPWSARAAGAGRDAERRSGRGYGATGTALQRHTLIRRYAPPSPDGRRETSSPSNGRGVGVRVRRQVMPVAQPSPASTAQQHSAAIEKIFNPVNPVCRTGPFTQQRRSARRPRAVRCSPIPLRHAKDSHAPSQPSCARLAAERLLARADRAEQRQLARHRAACNRAAIAIHRFDTRADRGQPRSACPRPPHAAAVCTKSTTGTLAIRDADADADASSVHRT
ncbi:hypothetical protein CFBP6762_03718 [Xanthomonas arboricola pv. fragariae]|nr:hypothetical protein CFBP6762_03718 [Xanthomonas arboricola pv. fragariae]